MKFSSLATPPRLVLASSGRTDQVSALLANQAPRLAAALDLPLHTLAPAACPQQALQHLAAIAALRGLGKKQAAAQLAALREGGNT